MRFILAASSVPFVNGGARFIVEWLEEALREAGHEVERYYLPFDDDPRHLLTQMAAFRTVDLSHACDRLICFRPPAHLIRHPHKILWFIHHIRTWYDLWDTEFGPPKTEEMFALRREIRRLDDLGLREAEKVFTNSRIVGERLRVFNDLASTPLYPPIRRPDRFGNAPEDNGEILCVCRVEPHKRQLLAVEAMRHVRTPVRLRLCGAASSEVHRRAVLDRIRAHRLHAQVFFDDRWISEGEKAWRLSRCLAALYLPKDEDSYGYPSLEAAHSRKAVVTTTDSGGVLEFVEDGVNGLVVAPEPEALAAAFDRLWLDREEARRLGAAQPGRLQELGISWDRVVEALAS